MVDGGARLDAILDAAYRCFLRHGMRRTTMDDIAVEAHMSRPAVYQYVPNKDEVFRRLAQRVFSSAVAQAKATPPGSLSEQLRYVLGVKLELTERLVRESPHATELLAGTSTVCADLVQQYAAQMTGIAAGVISDAARRGEIALGTVSPEETAAIAMAFVRGLEADVTDPAIPRRRLADGIGLLVAGLSRDGGMS